MSSPKPMQFGLPRGRVPRLWCIAMSLLGLTFGTLPGLAAAQEPRDGGRPAKGLSMQRGRELSHVPGAAALPPGTAATPPGPERRETPWRRVSPEARPALADGLTAEPREALRAPRHGGADPPATAGPVAGAASDPVRRMTPEQRGELRRQIREAHQERRAARFPRRD